MNDWIGFVQREYGLEVKSIRKQRGAVMCETEQGPYMLQPYQGSIRRLLAEKELLDQLYDRGFERTDRMILNRDGKLLSENEYQEKFVLRRWFCGEECGSFDIKRLCEGMRQLAQLHEKLRLIRPPVFDTRDADMQEDVQKEEIASEGIGTDAEPEEFGKEAPSEETSKPEELCWSWSQYEEHSLVEEMDKHNRELRKIRGYIQDRRKKTQFETCVLISFPGAYEQACRALTLLRGSDYEEQYQKARERVYLRHGDFNYHNLIFTENKGCAVVHFTRFGVQVQLRDLYDYLRKIMEKYNWDVSVGNQLLEEYNRYIPLSDQDLYILACLMLYPEKYWKQLNFFYNGNKTWISAKSIEKLTRAAVQCRDREEFIEGTFGVRFAN